MTLTGRARDAIRELKPVDIGKAYGLETIIMKLDALFLKDKNTRAYVAFKEFYSYKRRPGDTFTDFIVKFESLYHKITKYDMKLPPGVHTYVFPTECSQYF